MKRSLSRVSTVGTGAGQDGRGDWLVLSGVALESLRPRSSLPQEVTKREEIR